MIISTLIKSIINLCIMFITTGGEVDEDSSE